ncbi:hypothetical protein [Marinibacterium sp. SX1]|uniref:hypothetical protein n=1 Tax=Marinibacterium sp. SX1 TaxID=3388424 RepID=UPI003D182FCF
MTGVKRLIALVILVAVAVGAWFLTRPPAGADLLLSDVRATPGASGGASGAAGAGGAASPGPGAATITLAIANSGGPDRMIAVTSPLGTAAIRSSEGVDWLPIPAGSAPVLSTDGAWITLAPDATLADGQLVPLTLSFERAGPVTTQARVTAAGTGDDPHAGHAMPGMGDAAAKSPATVQVPQDRPVPTLSIQVSPDGDRWAVRVETTDFTFNEDMADGPHVPGVGHAHLYLDGVKLQRLYHRDATIGALPPGSYLVRVTLNTNDHRVYMHKGAPISATARIETD